jgi:hypothetical protein
MGVALIRPAFSSLTAQTEERPMSPAAPPAPTAPKAQRPLATVFEYDVFISRDEADDPWVIQELMKPLQDAGLNVTGEWDYLVGEYRVVARQEAVKKSRHTLVILTAAWCASPHAQDEGLQAVNRDPGATGRRLLPLLLKACELSPYWADLVQERGCYDFSSPDGWAKPLAKLLGELGRSRDTINQVLAQNARKGLAALSQLMGTLKDRGDDALMKYSLGKARDDITKLGRWKQLHECLHKVCSHLPTLQEKWEELKAAEAKAREAADDTEDRKADAEDALDDTWVKFEGFIKGLLSPAVKTVIRYAQIGGFDPAEVSWTAQLRSATDQLEAASGVDRDFVKIRTCVGKFDLVRQKMGQVNQRLIAAAREVPLRAVVRHLMPITQKLTTQEFTEQAAARVREVIRGIEAIGELADAQEVLVHNHDYMQTITDMVGPLDPRKVTAEDLAAYGTDLDSPLAELLDERGNDWVGALRAKREQLGEAVMAGLRAAADDRVALRRVRSLCNDLLSQVRTGFECVDLELLAFCDEVKQVGDSLNAALGGMS